MQMNKLPSGKSVFLTVNSNKLFLFMSHIIFGIPGEFCLYVSCWLQNDGNLLEDTAMNSFNRCFLSTWGVSSN